MEEIFLYADSDSLREEVLIKTNRVANLKSRGKVIRTVREQYLRKEVHCRSLLCLHVKRSNDENCWNRSVDRNKIHDRGGCLPIGSTHYIIPCYDIVKNYLEIFELPDITGIIFLQSIASLMINDVGKRQYNKILNIVRDGTKSSAVFLNEIGYDTHVPRVTGQSIGDWLMNVTYKAAKWYMEHLQGLMPLVIVTENETMIQKYHNDTKNIFVIHLKQYLEEFWSDIVQAQELYESISMNLEEESGKESEKLYSQYIPSEVITVGIKSGRYFEGRLRVNKYNAQEEAFVSISKVGTKDSADVIILGMKNRNRAVDGDDVVIEVLKDSEVKLATNFSKGKELLVGKVVSIVQRRWRDYVAVFQDDDDLGSNRKGGNSVIVVPYDYRIPKIRIRTTQAQDLQDHRVVVRIDRWEIDSNYPQGHFVKTLGKIGNLETEVSTLLIEHGVSVLPFSKGLLSQLPVVTPDKPWSVDNDEVSKRRDLRDTHLLFSIDPKGCEDVDDTLSIRELDNGNVELGVHIADVTYFVPMDSLADSEAKARSTTVYLADRRYDMLPAVLSANLCSLLSGVDRYAVSVLWELNSKFEVENIWFGRTVIKSSYKLFYEVAQLILDGKTFVEVRESINELKVLTYEEGKKRFKQLKGTLECLTIIARSLKNKRHRAGAVELDSLEVQFEFDDVRQNQLDTPKPKEHLEIHETVAECMIFANHWVAKKISEVFPHEAILRHHPPPRMNDLMELKDIVLSLGFNFDVSSNKGLNDSLNMVQNPNDAHLNTILRMMTTRAMSEANYISSGSFSSNEYYHYGLGLEKYTHFTSPIRRYADIIVHRLLLYAVSETGSSVNILSNEELQDLCGHINYKHKAAKNIQKDSSQLFQILFFKNLEVNDVRRNAEGVVYNLRNNGVVVIIPEYGMKGMVALKNKEEQVAVVKNGRVTFEPGQIIQSEGKITVQSEGYYQTYTYFDKLMVKINVQESRVHATKFSFDLLGLKSSVSPGFAQKIDLVTEVKSQLADNEEEKLSTDNEETKKETSLYQLMLEMKQMSLKVP